MTTFIDFRFSRALASALFSGEEQEEVDVVLASGNDNYLAVELQGCPTPGSLGHFLDEAGNLRAKLELSPGHTVCISDTCGQLLIQAKLSRVESHVFGIRCGPEILGIKTGGKRHERRHSLFAERADQSSNALHFECSDGVRVLGRGSGRASRWGELFYKRNDPDGPCVELTMDWHHLRAGIPLFSTMTVEELVAQGKFRLRFRSYAYEASDAETTDFVRLFACSDPAEIAVHMTPSLYMPRTPGIPNLAFAVAESERVHPHLVERCNRMERLCVPSTFVRDALRKSGVVRPIEVVLHGVDTDFFRPAGKRQPLPGGRRFNFLAVGTHVERKNFRYLVRAFLEEFGESEDVALFLLLRPEYHTTQNNVVLEFTEWEREWARDSSPILLWTGYLTREHLRDFYAHADAYLMPSNEGFGLTLLEAMSCGTPVIGLDRGGVLDFLTPENGVLVPTGKTFIARDIDTLPYVGDTFHTPETGALRKAMRHLFEHDVARECLGKNARKTAETLSWESVSRQFAEVVERTLENDRMSRQAESKPDAQPSARTALSIVLCVLDDADARKSLAFLRRVIGRNGRVLCLFTRYARIRDVLLSRKLGFVNYRWDGTMDNCMTIARVIFGQSWVVVLNAGERFSGDLDSANEFLNTLPYSVGEVAVACGSTGMESRIFHTRHPDESKKTGQCKVLVITGK